LYLYKQDVLTPIATFLVYKLTRLASGIESAVKIRTSAMIRLGTHFTNASNDERVIMLATLLKRSYLCSTVGVAFTNCVPVPVDNMAKSISCASLFSDWLGKVIKIHNSFGFKNSHGRVLGGHGTDNMMSR